MELIGNYQNVRKQNDLLLRSSIVGITLRIEAALFEGSMDFRLRALHIETEPAEDVSLNRQKIVAHDCHL